MGNKLPIYYQCFISRQSSYLSPDGWTTDSNTGKQYKVVGKGRFNHEKNKQTCKDNGGFLPEPRTEEENKFLKDFNDLIFWLGAVRSGDRFEWISDRTEVTYTNWKVDGPRDQDCIIRNLWGDDWQTLHCEGGLNCDTNPMCNIVCQRNGGKFSYFVSVKFFKLPFDMFDINVASIYLYELYE